MIPDILNKHPNFTAPITATDHNNQSTIIAINSSDFSALPKTYTALDQAFTGRDETIIRETILIPILNQTIDSLYGWTCMLREQTFRENISPTVEQQLGQSIKEVVSVLCFKQVIPNIQVFYPCFTDSSCQLQLANTFSLNSWHDDILALYAFLDKNKINYSIKRFAGINLIGIVIHDVFELCHALMNAWREVFNNQAFLDIGSKPTYSI